MNIRTKYVWHYLSNDGRLLKTDEMAEWGQFDSREEAIDYLQNVWPNDYDWAGLVIVECYFLI